ncbi:MAG: substrate-binding domain-containing protein [Erysipelotrichaceae bacterium]|nr:substrate-binding domain-containing protein [Erysipelotrichaceae bacterium]
MICIGIILLFSLIFSTASLHNRKYFIFPAVFVVCALLCGFTYFESPNYKYRNLSHGFEYMNGFSSTDFSDYHVYNENNKLVSLDHEPEFMIEDVEDMPVMDGAEATYPLYAAVAKTLYKNIDSIEMDYKKFGNGSYENGKIVTFYNTAVGFERLVEGEVDLFFGAKPSASQQEYAKEAGVELVYTPIGKEAFVFFVEEDNPVDSLTADQIKSIYHGDITNWKKLGGKNEEIIAFQRPERSGSQSMMVYFMGDVSLKEPLTHEMEASMMGIVENVVEYQNEAGAIGYSFRYFLEGLNEVENVKILEVDDVYPSNETIQNGTYPLVATLYCITVKDNNNPYVQKVIDFLLSEDGQSLVEMTGYSPLN